MLTIYGGLLTGTLAGFYAASKVMHYIGMENFSFSDGAAAVYFLGGFAGMIAAAILLIPIVNAMAYRSAVRETGGMPGVDY